MNHRMSKNGSDLEEKTGTLKMLFRHNLKNSSALWLEHAQSKDEARIQGQGFLSCIMKVKVLYGRPKGMFAEECFSVPSSDAMLVVINNN
jgi:hypothetical protein